MLLQAYGTPIVAQLVNLNSNDINLNLRGPNDLTEAYTPTVSMGQRVNINLQGQPSTGF